MLEFLRRTRLGTSLDCKGQSGVSGQIRGVKNNLGCQDSLDVLGASLVVLINPVCTTRDATKLLLQFEVLCNVAGKQQEHTSILWILDIHWFVPYYGF